MRRRRLAVLLVVVLATALTLVAPAPASAIDVCAGQGTANTGPLYYPVTVDPNSTLVTVRQPGTTAFGFTFTPGLGACLSTSISLNKQLTAGGTLTGWCGHSSGQGSAHNGHTFAWVSVGSLLILTGHLVGILHAIPNQLAGESCLTGALNFIVTGAVVLLPCALLTSALARVPVPETLGVVVPGALAVHTGDMNYHVSVCVP